MGEILVSETKDILNPNSMTFDDRQEQLKKEEAEEIELRKQEKKSPFGRWTQFNLEKTKPLMQLTLDHPKARAILDFLVDQMDDYNAVMCSYQVLQEVFEISRSTAALAVKALKERGFIAILKSGSSNIYAINDSVYWKSWGNNKQYSKFPANIILSLSEQEENLQLKIKTIKHKEITTGQEK